ncbi:hypothetical protein PHYBLDRAFT_70504 [Phycomyces blakesleeanus NRRL 1555(-)]|uniref:Uncharacterized protein n=1 Tax=Phycomyces blakesleeanus (strain ATCC 8743b / DSM 1359 / FGSC 10004 / NBRC 33097 / NRRL 1555) TaxID=763407 RepID=A0A162NHZ2_PHYB8|nr:hypothetical protein PHYBLDRAFT_70504 [Phycomyces blakesleeanus NRRL 1555(-)]OAD69844.1 hypothetical protein PHYBLDRAFT_70504 [Phycomyces blakesleeanus NRRL 1555(-)]|eukprot:XP_018287884.1 hypothetical protein PHYBLDRAFT_70504 [Phycomyces blakesleeanus NRRL 1555(-)]
MEEDVNPYHLGTLINIRRYCESQGPKQESLIKELDTRMEDAGKIVGAVKDLLYGLYTAINFKYSLPICTSSLSKFKKAFQISVAVLISKSSLVNKESGKIRESLDFHDVRQCD